MTKSPWVVCDAVKQVMRCDRCGDTEPLSLINGRRIDMACKIMNGFRELHDDCKQLSKDDIKHIIDKTDIRRMLQGKSWMDV